MSSSIIKTIRPLGFPWATQDPFLFCVHHRDEYPNGNSDMGPASSLSGRNIGQDFVIKDGWRMYHGSKIPGFPYHPHRGFETITVAEEGFVDHSDSMGAAGRFSAGDVQWMTAGKGVLHSEMFPLLEEEKDNPLEIFQIWLNLPAKNKFVEPHFKMLWNENIPEIKHTDSNGKKTIIRVIAGDYDGKKALEPTPDSWAADHTNHVSILLVKLEAGAQFTLPSSGDQQINRTIYFYKGDKIDINSNEVSSGNYIEIDSDQKLKIKSGFEDSRILILQGRPINEPVVQHGPFVMNTQEEIQEAFAEYRRTQFGGWPWDQEEKVHGKKRGRFALHADGTLEEK